MLFQVIILIIILCCLFVITVIFLGAKFRLGFVGYRDYGARVRMEKLDFTPDVTAFQNKVCLMTHNTALKFNNYE